MSNISILESLVDHLQTELSCLNEMLIKCGFIEGIETLKMAVTEFLAK